MSRLDPGRQALRWRALAVALIPIAAALAGCGSTESSNTAASTSLSGVAAASTDPTESTPTPATTSTSAAEPNTGGSTSFVVNAGTNGGDAVKIEGWFGPPVPAGESNVDQTALGECSSPTDDGRAIAVALDLTVTMESSLAGEVELNLGSFSVETLGEYILGFSSGAQCSSAEVNPTGIKLGTLQPHQSTNFSVWVVFINAITPNAPHPSEATLRANNWLMALPRVTVDGETNLPNEEPSASGPRVVKCVAGPIESGDTIAVVGGMPKVMHGQCP